MNRLQSLVCQLESAVKQLGKYKSLSTPYWIGKRLDFNGQVYSSLQINYGHMEQMIIYHTRSERGVSESCFGNQSFLVKFNV